MNEKLNFAANTLKTQVAFNITKQIPYELDLGKTLPEGAIYDHGFIRFTSGDQPVKSLALQPIHVVARVHNTLMQKSKSKNLKIVQKDENGNEQEYELFYNEPKWLSNAISSFSRELSRDIQMSNSSPRDCNIIVYKKFKTYVDGQPKWESASTAYTSMANGWLQDSSGELNIPVTDLNLEQLLRLENQLKNGIFKTSSQLPNNGKHLVAEEAAEA